VVESELVREFCSIMVIRRWGVVVS